MEGGITLKKFSIQKNCTENIQTTFRVTKRSYNLAQICTDTDKRCVIMF